MTGRRRSRGEAEIEELLSRLDPGTERYALLSATRDFKASWVELGERLTQVRERETFRDWGYTDFDAYCRRELRLKADTANKLTRSFAFLRDHEPTSLRQHLEPRDEGGAMLRELPPLDVVDLLSRAGDRTKLNDKQLDAIRTDVFSGELEPSRSNVLKRFRELDPEAFKSPPRPERTAGEGDLRKALLLAERLLSLIEGRDDVSQKNIQGVRGTVSELRELFESTRQVSA